MEDSELKNMLFNRYGVAMPEDDPAWWIFQIHADLNETLADLIQNADKTATKLKNNSNGVVDEFQKINNTSNSLISQVDILQKNLDNSLKMAVEKYDKKMMIQYETNLKYNSDFFQVLHDHERNIQKTISEIDLSDISNTFRNRIENTLKDLLLNSQTRLDIAAQNINNSVQDFENVTSTVDKNIKELHNKANILTKSVQDFDTKILKLNKKIILLLLFCFFCIGIGIGIVTTLYVKDPINITATDRENALVEEIRNARKSTKYHREKYSKLLKEYKELMAIYKSN